MTVKRLTFADTPPAERPLAADGPTVVLDSAWTPGPDDVPGALPIRPLFGAVIEGHDLFEEALDLVDQWAAATGIADLLLVEGVSYWFRVRETAWHWVHERLLWRYTFALIDAGGPYDEVVLPWTEGALLDVLRAMNRSVAVVGEPEPVVAPVVAVRSRSVGSYVPSTVRRAVRPVLGPLARRLRPRTESAGAAEARRQGDFLSQRFERLSGMAGPRVIVLTLPSSYQRIGGPQDPRRRDPNLGSVIPALAEAGLEPIVIGWGMNRGRAEDWAAIELDERLLPAYFLQERFGRREDDQRALAAVEAVVAVLDPLAQVPLDAGGVDLAPPLVAALRAALTRTINADVRELARVERLLQELRPRAILMAQEGHRTAWLMGGARASLPTFAIQHGVLYRTHPGYPPTRHPALALPSCTFVYGDYSRRVLLAGAYRETEVEVSGSPRLDLDAGIGHRDESAAARQAERALVRDELGVAVSDRLLVVSTVNLAFVRRSHQVHMIERLLGGPLPGVHVVFKQHPGERDEGPYRALLTGIAQAAGVDPPALSVVRDIDLYRLLRAADAHVGLHSTVLTDAVAAGTPNLIALVEGHADLLGYVAAGVAQPVRNVADVLAALASPPIPDPAARRAFLEDHFRPGVASGRIVDAIRDRLD